MPTDSSIPSTMRAWVRTRRGPAHKVLKLATDVPTPAVPEASSSDVFIRVSHVAVQFTTEFVMNLVPKLPFTGPWIPEVELSGEVVAAGERAPAEVRDPGTTVTAFRTVPSEMFMGNGMLSEYVRVNGNRVVRIDPALDMASSSGVNGCGSCALEMLRRTGVHNGHTVLVNGASGAVGTVLVQLCKLRGAKVVGVASGGNEDMVRGLGADEFVDYRKHDPLPDYLAQQYGDKPFDFVFDCVGKQALFVNSPAYLKPEGIMVNIGSHDGMGVLFLNVLLNTYLPTWLGGVPRRYIMFGKPPTREETIYIVRLIEEGRLRIPVDSVFDMEDAVQAYERIASKRARGKVVIKVRSD